MICQESLSPITKVDCPNSLGKSMDVVVVDSFAPLISYFNVFAPGSYSGL